MTPALREELRHNLIAQLCAVRPLSVPVAALKVGARVGGIIATDTELNAELDYLRDKGVATTIEKTISPENARWKITADGCDYAAANGLG